MELPRGRRERTAGPEWFLWNQAFGLRRRWREARGGAGERSRCRPVFILIGLPHDMGAALCFLPRRAGRTLSVRAAGMELPRPPGPAQRVVTESGWARKGKRFLRKPGLPFAEGDVSGSGE